jgi:hypothetical protein
MRRIRITVRVIVVLVLFSFFHYVLPQHDIVRVTGTSIIPTDLGGLNSIFYAQTDSGNATLATRSLRLINTSKQDTYLLGFLTRTSESIMVYRNEDTGWIWPPYFKFDSSDLQATADANISGPDTPRWVVVTHYGWRNRFFTIYPNAVAISPVAGPDVRIIPWFNIFFFAFLAVAYFFVRAMWRQFRQRSVDPLVESASDQWDKVEAGVSERRGRLGRWLDSWRAKPRQ